MDYNKLEDLNKEFAQQSNEMNQEFIELFKKWLKRDPRTTMINAVHLPLNVIMNLIKQGKTVSTVFPELPDMFIRFFKPFEILKNKWGKIPDTEFANEYKKIYESQFIEWFPSKEEKEKFVKWFEKNNQKN